MGNLVIAVREAGNPHPRVNVLLKVGGQISLVTTRHVGLGRLISSANMKAGRSVSQSGVHILGPLPFVALLLEAVGLRSIGVLVVTAARVKVVEVVVPGATSEV